MKATTLLIGTLVFFFSIANAQLSMCPHTVLVSGGFPTTGDFQWSGPGDPALDECPTCIPFDRFYSWDLLDTGNVLIIHGNFTPPCDTIQIRIVQDCRHVYYDTCLVLPVTGSGCEIMLDIDPPANSQLLVYWRSSNTDSIGVIALEVNDGSPLDSILYDMHLCTVLSTPSPPVDRKPTPPIYTELHTARATVDYPTEPGVYIRSWPEDPWRAREKIIIVRR